MIAVHPFLMRLADPWWENPMKGLSFFFLKSLNLQEPGGTILPLPNGNLYSDSSVLQIYGSGRTDCADKLIESIL